MLAYLRKTLMVTWLSAVKDSSVKHALHSTTNTQPIIFWYTYIEHYETLLKAPQRDFLKSLVNSRFENSNSCKMLSKTNDRD